MTYTDEFGDQYERDIVTEAMIEDWNIHNDHEDLSGEMEDDEGYWGGHDVEADADTLASAGWGTDEDYGYFGDEF